MRSHENRPAHIYRIGSPRDYLLGAGLLIAALWFAWEFLHAEHLHAVDRPIMAALAMLTFGGMGVVALLRGGMRAVIVEGDRVCIRAWTSLSRCFAMGGLRRVVWNYRYAEGMWARYDQGRAWVEFEFAEEGGDRTVVAVDYAGRARHPVIERLTRDLAERADLSWNPRGDPVEATDLPAAEVIWTLRCADRRAEPTEPRRSV